MFKQDIDINQESNLSDCLCANLLRIVFLIIWISVSSSHTNEPSASNEKPQSSRPRGLGSSMRLEKKKILAKAGRGLSFLSHFSKKSNDEGIEDNLAQG